MRFLTAAGQIQFMRRSNLTKLKVVTIVGTRPEIIRLSRVVSELEKTCNHVLVHTGQNYDYELNQIFFDDLEIKKPDYFLDCAAQSQTAADTIGQVISAADRVLRDERPDAILVLGDTNSCLSVIAAKRLKIPIFHMEAGNRCFDQRVPEEINRKIVDHTADINLTYSSIAREYLLREGLPPDQIIKTGSPMNEVLTYYYPKIRDSDILTKLGVQPKEYFLVSTHREENIEDLEQFKKLMQTLNQIGDEYKNTIFVSTHPRTRNKIKETGVKLSDKIVLLKPLGFFDYVQLQRHARVVLSDSGTITEEANILNFPAINLREAHERPEGMEEGAVIMAGVDARNVLIAISVLEKQRWELKEATRIVGDYQWKNVSEKVVRLILSYTHYINRVVWKKY